MAVGCKRCALFSACPLKGVIGDYKEPEDTQAQPPPKDGKQP
jgi:hypothetical protein